MTKNHVLVKTMEAIAMQGSKGLTLGEIIDICPKADITDIYKILNTLQCMNFVNIRYDKVNHYCYNLQHTKVKKTIGFIN